MLFLKFFPTKLSLVGGQVVVARICFEVSDRLGMGLTHHEVNGRLVRDDRSFFRGASPIQNGFHCHVVGGRLYTVQCRFKVPRRPNVGTSLVQGGWSAWGSM